MAQKMCLCLGRDVSAKALLICLYKYWYSLCLILSGLFKSYFLAVGSNENVCKITIWHETEKADHKVTAPHNHWSGN